MDKEKRICMKLFEVSYMNEYSDEEKYLKVGESKEQVEKQEKDFLDTENRLYELFNVSEITEIDGYYIRLDENE